MNSAFGPFFFFSSSLLARTYSSFFINRSLTSSHTRLSGNGKRPPTIELFPSRLYITDCPRHVRVYDITHILFRMRVR